jgi:hypothetical protein
MRGQHPANHGSSPAHQGCHLKRRPTCLDRGTSLMGSMTHWTRHFILRSSACPVCMALGIAVRTESHPQPLLAFSFHSLGTYVPSLLVTSTSGFTQALKEEHMDIPTSKRSKSALLKPCRLKPPPYSPISSREDPESYKPLLFFYSTSLPHVCFSSASISDEPRWRHTLATAGLNR